MLNPIDTAIREPVHRSGGQRETACAVCTAVLATAVLLSLTAPIAAAPSGSQPPPQTQGVTVSQSGDTLLVKGQNANAGDVIRITGNDSAMDVYYNGAHVGAFQAVAHIDVGIWGFRSVGVLLYGVQIKGNATIATDGGSDVVALVYSEIGGAVNVNTGPGDDGLFTAQCLLNNDLNVDTTDGADHVTINDNQVSGNLVVSTGDGDDIVEIERNSIDTDAFLDLETGESDVLFRANDVVGDTIVETGPGGSTVTVSDNWIRDDLSLMTSGVDYIRVLRNDVDSDVSITTGAMNGPEYIFVKDENRIKGNLSINVGDCAYNVIDVIRNAVDRETAITLGRCDSGWDVTVEKNAFRGNMTLVTLDAASPVQAGLDQNLFEGDLQVNTAGAMDEVYLVRSTCDGDAVIDLGGGDDDLALGYQWAPGTATSTFNGNLSVNGGAGSDTLYHDLLNSYAFPPSSQGFENVIPF